MEEYNDFNCPPSEMDLQEVSGNFKQPMDQREVLPEGGYPNLESGTSSVRPVARVNLDKYPRLTDSKINKFIEAKCWVNGTYLDSLDTEYLVNCKKFAQQRLYDKWYWKYFLNLVNEEIVNRDVAIGPKRFYPGTENIPRRGGNGTKYGYR